MALALVLPAAARAQRPGTLAPPGNSAVSQYLETIPTDRGGGVARPLGSQGGTPSQAGGHRGALTPGERQALGRLGADGRTLEALVAETSPASETSQVAGAARGRTGANGPANAPAGGENGSGLDAKSLSGDGGPSPVGLMLSAAAGRGGGGLGALLPALIGVGALAAVVRLIHRRRLR
jgi:hypothetical protein